MATVKSLVSGITSQFGHGGVQLSEFDIPSKAAIASKMWLTE
jgi:hypothetical protein